MLKHLLEMSGILQLGRQRIPKTVKKRSRFALLLPAVLFLTFIFSTDGLRHEIASNVYWLPTDIEVEIGRSEYSLYYKHTSPCRIIESIGKEDFKYDIGNTMFTRLNKRCEERYNNTWKPLLEKLVQTWFDNGKN